MQIEKDTQLCISVAARPSNFGTTIHNAVFRKLGLNFIYKAFGITDIAGAVVGVRALGIRGCSVSMPFKESVVPYLDEVDPIAARVSAVNTVVNTSGHLIGFNSDVYGAQCVLAHIKDLSSKRVVLLGTGGVAKAILHALRELGAEDVLVVGRTLAKADALCGKLGCRAVRWEERHGLAGEVLINATPVGMEPNRNECPVDENVVARFSTIMDVVVSPAESRLLRTARLLGKEPIAGYRMSLYQAAKQFQLYTGVEAPLEVMEAALMNYLRSSRKIALPHSRVANGAISIPRERP